VEVRDRDPQQRLHCATVPEARTYSLTPGIVCTVRPPDCSQANAAVKRDPGTPNCCSY